MWERGAGLASHRMSVSSTHSVPETDSNPSLNSEQPDTSNQVLDSSKQDHTPGTSSDPNPSQAPLRMTGIMRCKYAGLQLRLVRPINLAPPDALNVSESTNDNVRSETPSSGAPSELVDTSKPPEDLGTVAPSSSLCSGPSTNSEPSVSSNDDTVQAASRPESSVDLNSNSTEPESNEPPGNDTSPHK